MRYPFYLWGAWLNLVLVTLWMLVFLLMGVFSHMFWYTLAVAVGILLFADWVYNLEKEDGRKK